MLERHVAIYTAVSAGKHFPVHSDTRLDWSLA